MCFQISATFKRQDLARIIVEASESFCQSIVFTSAISENHWLQDPIQKTIFYKNKETFDEFKQSDPPPKKPDYPTLPSFASINLASNWIHFEFPNPGYCIEFIQAGTSLLFNSFQLAI